jgi:hypothetical protein
MKRAAATFRIRFTLCPAGPKDLRMADLYLKNLHSERKSLWATCRLKGLDKDTPERQRIAALDEAIAAQEARQKGRKGIEP